MQKDKQRNVAGVMEEVKDSTKCFEGFKKNKEREKRVIRDHQESNLNGTEGRCDCKGLRRAYVDWKVREQINDFTLSKLFTLPPFRDLLKSSYSQEILLNAKKRRGTEHPRLLFLKHHHKLSLNVSQHIRNMQHLIYSTWILDNEMLLDGQQTRENIPGSTDD